MSAMPMYNLKAAIKQEHKGCRQHSSQISVFAFCTHILCYYVFDKYGRQIATANRYVQKTNRDICNENMENKKVYYYYILLM